MIVDVLVPARNVAATLREVLERVPARLVRSVVVVDRRSTDATTQVAQDAGAIVVRSRKTGYGSACRTGVRHLEALPEPPDVVVFMAGDGSDDPEEIAILLDPVVEDNAELVVGVRGRQRGSSSRLGVTLISALYRFRFADLGPFRAVRFPALVALGLGDEGDGYHAEMQVKAIKLALHIAEVPVSGERPRRGGLGRAAARAGRTVFQIVRHATTR